MHSTSIGESLDAFIAGAMPKTMPTATEKEKARKIDHGVTWDTKIIATFEDSPQKACQINPD